MNLVKMDMAEAEKRIAAAAQVPLNKLYGKSADLMIIDDLAMEGNPFISPTLQREMAIKWFMSKEAAKQARKEGYKGIIHLVKPASAEIDYTDNFTYFNNHSKLKLKPNLLRRLLNMFTNRKLKEEISDLREILDKERKHKQELYTTISALQVQLDLKEIEAFERDIAEKGKYFIQMRTTNANEPLSYSIYERRVTEEQNWSPAKEAYTSRKRAKLTVVGTYSTLAEAEVAVDQLLKGAIDYKETA